MSAIAAAVAAAFKFAWGWLLPYVGPLWAAAGPWLSWVPGISAIGKTARVASYVAAMGLAAWLAVSVRGWWEGDKLTQRESKAQCVRVVDSAYLRAERQALQAHRIIIAAQAARRAHDETQNRQLEGDLTDATNLSPDRRPVVAGDDPWLRAWGKWRR